MAPKPTRELFPIPSDSLQSLSGNAGERATTDELCAALEAAAQSLIAALAKLCHLSEQMQATGFVPPEWAAANAAVPAAQKDFDRASEAYLKAFSHQL